MSKYVKGLQMESLRRQFTGVDDVVVANVIGLNSKESHDLRVEPPQEGNLAGSGEEHSRPQGLRRKRVQRGQRYAVRRQHRHRVGAAPAIVELAREIAGFAKKIEKFELKGVCMSGTALVGAEKVIEVSKLPSRVELLGQSSPQFTSPGSSIAALATGPGAQIVSQIKSIAEKEDAPATAA